MRTFHYITTGVDDVVYKETFLPSLEKLSKNKLFPRKIQHMAGTEDSIFKKYNDALDNIIDDIKDDDIIVFSHDDIKLLDENFEAKLDIYFRIEKNIGIAGVIGTTHFNKSGGWWTYDRKNTARGHIVQGFKNNEQPTFHMVDKVGCFDNMMTVDGCIMFMPGSVAKDFVFDDVTYDGYHWYDADTCFEIINKGLKVGVVDILVEHLSEGPLPPSYIDSANKFYKKWNNQTFPVSIETFERS